MEIRLPAHGTLHKGYIVLKATCQKDQDLVLKLFQAKKSREERNRKEFYIQAHLSLPHQRRTYKQNNSVWKLVTAIFESMENRAPLEEEKTALYYDLLEVYADKIPNRFNNALRPIHISEANSVEGSRFIDGLLSHLATQCELGYGTQATVQSVLEEWEEWKGQQETDPSDYQDIGCTQMLAYTDWVEKHPYSEASGRGGKIVRAHIVSRGSDAPDIEMPWNWMALLWEEHEEQHRIGWDNFLQRYPHLRGRVDRARNLAGKLELEFKSGQGATEYRPKNLAMAALEDI
jgi:hypothetical protein